MTIQVAATDENQLQESRHLDRLPDECPICHVKVSASPRLWIARNAEETQGCFRCTNARCQSLFIAVYYSGPQSVGRLTRCEPERHVTAAVASELTEVSPSFGEIDDQALASETYGLAQLTGIGLRKSLEFLVKDYCMRIHPSEAETIRKVMLGPCIERFVDDAKVKACAKRAAWLGNDETHYVRKWEDRDIKDLKTLLKLTMLWVEGAILTEKFAKEMTDG